MSTPAEPVRKPFIARPTRGRRYDMGPMQAVFLADGHETDSRYSVSEWWLQPQTRGPGPHSHPEDHIFYVLAGTLSLFLNGEWTEATRGYCAVIPAGNTHDFENRGVDECGFLSINAPGGFEEKMPDIVQWFAEHPPEKPAAR